MRIPDVVASWNMKFRAPRSLGGAISDRYSGTDCNKKAHHSAPKETSAQGIGQILPGCSHLFTGLTAEVQKKACVYLLKQQQRLAVPASLECCSAMKGDQKRVLQASNAAACHDLQVAMALCQP